MVAVDGPGMDDNLMRPRRLAQQFSASLPNVSSQHRIAVIRSPRPHGTCSPKPCGCRRLYVSIQPIYTANAAIPCRLKAWGFLIPYRGL